MLSMKRFLLALTVFCSAATSITACHNANKRVYSDYPSFQQAESECNSWKKKGGTWELKVDEFRISASETDQNNASQFPICSILSSQKPLSQLMCSFNLAPT